MKRYLILLLALLLTVPGSARPVKGTVRSGGEKLAGVLVTDGYSVTVTDARGRFVIDPADDAEFVYITTPDGYHAPIIDGVQRYFVRVGERADFDLVPWTGEGHAILAVADPQTATTRHFGRFRDETEPDMAALAADYAGKGIRPAGLYLGDLSWDNMEIYADYKSHFERLGFPVWPVIGNYDYDENLSGPENSRRFRDEFGPLYYGFVLGDTHFIVLNSIIYDTGKKYTEDVDAVQMAWLAEYVKHIEPGGKVYIAMHSPTGHPDRDGFRLPSADRLLELFAARGITPGFMSGHAHVNWNREIAPGIWEHNVGSAGGAWWLGDFGKDGTPNGYKVFEFIPGKPVAHYYKSTGKDRSYRYEVFDRGFFHNQPNAVALKLWDGGADWKAGWWQDGEYMGEMEPFSSYDSQYLAMIDKYKVDTPLVYEYTLGKYRWPALSHMYLGAVPSPYAREVELAITDRDGKVTREKLTLSTVDVQAHRGGMGLMPENTIEAMLMAVQLGVNTLELDLQMSSDGQVVVSHDPYMNHKFVTRPDGEPITKAEQTEYVLYRMTYDSIKTYDTGSKPHPDYPGQANIPTYKPLLSDLIDTIEAFTEANGYSPVNYNIEIKSSEQREQAGMVPHYIEFANAAMEVLRSKNLGDRLIVQCFDTRTLNYLYTNYAGFRFAYLVDKGQDDFEANMALLRFIPDWYSPHHTLVSETELAKWRAAGMKIVPWTVDRPEDIERMVSLGVDAIISNYPDRVLKITRKY